MAEKVEIDIPGIGLVEAKNAATEATLLEILSVLSATQKDANKNAKGKPGGKEGGGKEAKEGAENLSKFNKETKDGIGAAKTFAQAGQLAGKSAKLLGFAAGAAAMTTTKLANAAGSAANGVIGLGKSALDLGTKFSDILQTMANVGDSTTAAAGALRMIPVVGGPLAGAFGAVAGAVEGSVKSYQTAASVGATFNGSVQDMSRAASGAGMTLDQFANLIKNNAENLIYLGGTTEAGAKQFAGLAKELQSSGAGAELQRLGFTTEQINGGMAKYIGILGKTGAIQGMTTSQIAAASGSYLKELDALAKITGQTREEKQKEQDALMRDAQVRAAMAGMDAESQRQMMNYITSFPKEQQAAIKDMIATGNVTSEEAIKLQSMLPGVAEQTMQFGRTMQAGGKINAEQMNSARNNAIREAKDSVLRNKARGMYDKEAGEAYVGAANLAAMEIDGLSKAMGEQGKATEKANLAENLTKAKQRLAEFSNGFQQALANPAMLNMLMKSFETLATFVQQVIVPAFNIFAQVLSAVIPVVTGLLMPALMKLGEFMQSTVIPAFNILGIWVRDAIVPIFKQAWTIISETVGSFTKMLGITDDVGDGLGAFEEILYDISYFIEDNLQPILLGFGVLIGAVIVAKVVAFGAAMVAMMAPLASFAVGVASATFSILKMAAGVAISAVQFVGSLTMMAARAAIAGISFLAVNAPLALVAIGVMGLVYGFKKLGGDLTILTDAFKWAGSWVSTLFLKLQLGIYSLLNKIPGMRGDFNDDIKNIGEKLKENEDNRAKLEDDMAKRRQENLQKQRDEEAKALADKKKEEKEQRDKEAQGDAEATARNEKADRRAEERAARKARREQDAIAAKEKAELDAVGAKEDREKAAAEAKDVTVDKSDPIKMLKTFAAQQNSGLVEKPVAAGSPSSTAATAATVSATGTPTVDKAAVTEGVGNLYQQTQDAINKGIKYGFGSKDLKTGAIDCSGWIANINTNMMNSINKEAGKEIYGKEAKKAFQGSAADIIKNVSAAGGGMLEGSKAIRSQLKEGMLIGEDNGAKGWDAGRHKGIDHITQTVKDPKTGKLMISESQGGKGVTLTDPEEYFKRKEAKGVKLFGTDMTAMAKGAEGRATAPPSATANIPSPEAAAKARADTAATDQRRVDKPVASETRPAAAAEPRREETLQSLIRDGITPTTLAFQELINKGIKPFQAVMATGVQVKTPLNPINPKDSLSPGEEIVSKLRGTLDTDAGKSLMAAAKNMSTPTSFETPKTEIIAQAEKAAAEKAALEKEQAENRARLKQEEAMAMRGPSTQESPLSGSSDLNTALAELIAISKRTAELNEKQLSVQSSLSGDLFA